MGFSNQERINLTTKALAAGVLDANEVAQWYETRFPFEFQLNGSKVLLELDSIPTAASLSDARTNATNNPTLLQDLSQFGQAIRLTAVAGTNNSTWVAYSTYNDTSSALLDNWMLPQSVQQSSGAASIGYSIVLYDGDPNAGGSLVTTTDGTTGTGENKTVGWIWNYAIGMLLLAEDFRSSISDPYVLGFRYIGRTANTQTSLGIFKDFVADETVAAGDVLRIVQNGESGLTAGRVVKAINNSTDAQAEVIGIAQTAATQGNIVNTILSGTTTIQFGSAISVADTGKRIYLDSTSGRATTTAPTAANRYVVELGKILIGTGSTTPNCEFSPQFLVFLG